MTKIRVYFNDKYIDIIIDYDFRDFVDRVYTAGQDCDYVSLKKVDGNDIAIRVRDIEYMEQI